MKAAIEEYVEREETYEREKREGYGALATLQARRSRHTAQSR